MEAAAEGQSPEEVNRRAKSLFLPDPGWGRPAWETRFIWGARVDKGHRELAGVLHRWEQKEETMLGGNIWWEICQEPALQEGEVGLQEDILQHGGQFDSEIPESEKK
jgi:hypothetical protein